MEPEPAASSSRRWGIGVWHTICALLCFTTLSALTRARVERWIWKDSRSSSLRMLRGDLDLKRYALSALQKDADFVLSSDSRTKLDLLHGLDGGGVNPSAIYDESGSLVDVDSYAQLQVAPDPYDAVPKEVRDSWGAVCDSKCHRWLCAPLGDELHVVLREALAEWVRVTNLLNVVNVNIDGSLIASLYRNTTMMRWDTDIDFLIWAHDTAKFEDFAEGYNRESESTGFRLVVQPQWRYKYVAPYGGRSYFADLGVDFISPNLRLVHTSGNHKVHIDVYCMYADHHGAEEGVAHMNDFENVHLLAANDYEYVDIPRSWMFPLRPCYLEGIKTQCPSRGSLVLQKVYNADVRVPDHHLNEATGCWEKGAPQ